MQDTNLIFSDNTDMLPDNVAIYVTANQENCTTMRFDAWMPGLVESGCPTHLLLDLDFQEQVSRRT